MAIKHPRFIARLMSFTCGRASRPPRSTEVVSQEVVLNVSYNEVKDEFPDDLGKFPDLFTKVLDQEGMLVLSDPISKVPVLTVCNGFLNSELCAISWPHTDELRYKESFKQLDPEKKENYFHLFSSHYPLEPLIDGLPESVWLECVEPTLSILTVLSSLKHRKCNLSLRKCYVETHDSSSACRGDCEAPPLILNPFLIGRHVLLTRVQFLSLEGTLHQAFRNTNQVENIHELQAGGYSFSPVLHSITQRRQQMLRHRPHEALQEVLRDVTMDSEIPPRETLLAQSSPN